MKKTVLVLLLASSTAWAEGQGTPEVGMAKANAEATGGNATGGNATGGNATGGSTGEITNIVTGAPTSAVAKAGDADSESTANNSFTSNEENPRQAPGVYVGAAPSTAVGLKCFGIGFSQASNGNSQGIGLGHCWKQRDDWALARSVQLEFEGQYAQSVKAYCGQKFHYRDYGTETDCTEARTQMYKQRIAAQEERLDRESLLETIEASEIRARDAEERANRMEEQLRIGPK